MINEQIRDREIRLIGENGEQLGIMSARDAYKMAQEAELDLVKIAPTAKPPVCKIIDYGKYRYELARKEKEARKKQGAQQREKKQAKYNMAIENFRFENEDKYPTVKELYERIKSDSEAVGEKYPAEKTVRNSLSDLGYMIEKETGRICPTP